MFFGFRNENIRCVLFMALTLAVFLFSASVCSAASGPGDSRVLKWHGGKKAVFLLAFDDGCFTHIDKAIPELEKRGFVGTFYINPGKGIFKSRKNDWEKRLPKSPAVVYGNHTFTHCGATNVVQLDTELAKCHEVIYSCYPERKKPFLVSFGRPGGVPWKVTENEKSAALAKYNLIERPSFYGYPIHTKSKEVLCSLVDQAIKKGGMGHHDFHGVGGDWLVTPMDAYLALLDKLKACEKDVWVTDHITWHKYLKERDGAKVELGRVTKSSIRVMLDTSVDPELYDCPLTLETRVPSTWKKCCVVQGKSRMQIPVSGDSVRYEALPGRGEIELTPVY